MFLLLVAETMPSQSQSIPLIGKCLTGDHWGSLEVTRDHYGSLLHWGSLGMTVLLALTVFLLLVAETMPPQSQSIPLIGKCLTGGHLGSLGVTVWVTVFLLLVAEIMPPQSQSISLIGKCLTCGLKGLLC